MPITAHHHRIPGSPRALTTLSNGRHAFAADVDRALGSEDLAPDPHELLDAALAACTTLTLELYIRRRQLPVRSLRVDVTHTETRGADGIVHYALQRQLHVEGELSDADRAKLLEIAGKCPIHRILEGEITVASAWGDEAAGAAAPGASA